MQRTSVGSCQIHPIFFLADGEGWSESKYEGEKRCRRRALRPMIDVDASGRHACGSSIAHSSYRFELQERQHLCHNGRRIRVAPNRLRAASRTLGRARNEGRQRA